MTDARGHVTTFAYATDGRTRGQLVSVTEKHAPTWIQSAWPIATPTW